MKRLSFLLLAACMIITCFAGCGGTSEPEATTAGTTAATTASETTAASSVTTAEVTTAATTEATTADPWDLSTSSEWSADKWLEYEQTKLDFGGYTYTLLSTNTSNRTPGETEGALYDEWRDMIAELEYDINIKLVVDSCPADQSALMYTWIMAGENPGDSYEIKTHTWFPLYASNGLLKLSSDEVKATGLDVYNEQFLFQDFTHAWDIDGECYAMRWAGKYYAPEAGWVVFFNKDLLSAAGYDLYQAVRDGKWDFDMFLQAGLDVKADTDGDGQLDVFGISTGYLSYGEEVVICGGKIVDWDNGKLVSYIDSPEAMKAFTFMDKVANSGAIISNADGTANNSYKEGHVAFKEGKVGLLWSELDRARLTGIGGSTNVQDSLVDWGILPAPMQPGDDHYSNVLGGVNFDVMFISNRNWKTSCAIYAAIARRHNLVQYSDEWNEAALGMYLHNESDTDSAEMLLDYIYPGAVANWSWCSVEHNDTYRSEVVYKIFTETDSPASIVEAAKPKLQTLLDNLIGG